LIRQPIKRKEMTKGRQRGGEGKGGRRKGNEKRGEGEKEWEGEGRQRKMHN